MSTPSVVERELIRHGPGSSGQPSPDPLVCEEPLEIRVRGESVAVTMRTPGHDRELAAGFLYTEGIVKNGRDITEIASCQQGEQALLGNILNVFLAPQVQLDLTHLTRHVFASSSCGLCGKATIDSVHTHFAPVESDLTLPASILKLLPEAMRQAQESFERTGGVHAAALFNSKGELQVLREDVGRHNAVDKVVGWGVLSRQLPFAEHILLISGRASFEIMQKALAARVPIVAAVSAPSSLAVDFARASNQTLIGFLRGPGFNIYSHPQRIV